MYRRILTFLFSLVVFVAGAAAQSLIVKKFYHAERDFTANSGSTLVLDHNNGDPCALIKVRTNERGFTFDAGRLFPIEKTEEQGGAHPLDIYVWVQSGAKRLSIGHPQLGVLSEYDLQTTLLPGQTYILELGSGKVNVNIEEMATEQYVVFQLTPADAVVEIGGQMLKTVDGTAMKLMKFGTYQYTVKAPDYQMEVGRIEVNDPENKHIIRVQLKSNFTQMTLTAPDGAEIWVNGEKKGSGQWTGNLGAGVYKFEAKKAGHRDSQRTITLDPAAGPQTIALAAPTPILGKANISSEPALADIYIDGQKVGQTPFLASNLLVGSHSIKITRNGYADYNGTLTIKEGEKASFTASLKKAESAEELYKKGQKLYNQNNYQEAVIWYLKAAELGHAAAQNYLGFLYEKGWGVAQDFSEAVKWYRKAAEQDYASAQHNLGLCYENGKGVTRDYNEAVRWYRKAAEQGKAKAQCNLGWCYEMGNGVNKDYNEAVKWYRKAAEQGHAIAQNNLGLCYYYGRGVAINKQEAKRWFQKAADQGNQDAKEYLNKYSF